MSLWLNTTKRLHDEQGIEKPCHDLGYCPYGQLVEEFPLHEVARQHAIDSGRFTRWENRETGLLVEFPGNGGSWSPCKAEDEGARPDLNWAAQEVDDPYSCKVFGHECPVYYHAEFLAENVDS